MKRVLTCDTTRPKATKGIAQGMRINKALPASTCAVCYDRLRRESKVERNVEV